MRFRLRGHNRGTRWVAGAIEHFARHLDGITRREPGAFPLATFSRMAVWSRLRERADAAGDSRGPPWSRRKGREFGYVAGRLPGNENGNGLVTLDSANLEGRVDSTVRESKAATHLNLSGAWNAFTLLFRGWRCNDELWPTVVGHATDFVRGVQATQP
jgi:hypothetical protein